MTTQTLPDLQALARSLNLTALAEHLPRFLKQAEQQAVAYSEFTQRLLSFVFL